MKNLKQDKLTVSQKEIPYIAKVLGVSQLSIHIARFHVGNKRADITTWINANKDAVVTIKID